MYKTFMAIGGHIGDMELTVGGLLASLSLQGHRIVTVALTAGEKGNSPDQSVEDYRRQKIAEAQSFADMLHGTSIVLPYNDGELPDNDEVRFMVADLIRQYQPSMLFTHWKNSMHKDHTATHRIVKDAQFYAAIRGFARPLPPHYAAGPYYAENWEDAPGFQPYTYFKITPEGFALWQEAIKTQWFAVNSRDFKYAEYYSALMTTRGKLAHADYAEAFDIDAEKKIQVVDTTNW